MCEQHKKADTNEAIWRMEN